MKLTPSQERMMEALLDGLTLAEFARRTGKSPNAVWVEACHLRKKQQVKTTAALVKKYMEERNA